MSTKYDDDELCVGNDCRSLPKDGPIPYLPSVRFDITYGLTCIVCCICIMILIFALGPMIIKMNSKRIINIVKGSINPTPTTAASLLASTTSDVNVVNL